jgi:hypothetical protein
MATFTTGLPPLQAGARVRVLLRVLAEKQRRLLPQALVDA